MSEHDEITEEVPNPESEDSGEDEEIGLDEPMTGDEAETFELLVGNARRSKEIVPMVTAEWPVGVDAKIAKEELRYQEALLTEAAKGAEERKAFVEHLLKDLLDVAREEDLDSIPGWVLAAVELAPSYSSLCALFGYELRTRRDPTTGTVVGIRMAKMGVGRRAWYATLGELATSAKLSLVLAKLTKKFVARALKSSSEYVRVILTEKLTA